MHLTDLRYFQTIARAGNITSAARRLGVRQPTLTRQRFMRSRPTGKWPALACGMVPWST
jgi:hypothetical protein